MALRRKPLSERIGALVHPNPPLPTVELHIPTGDDTTEMSKGAAAFATMVQSLSDQHLETKKRNELLMRELVVVKNTLARIEAERDYWRKQALEYVRANGKITALVTGMFKLAEPIRDTLQEAQAVADQMFPGQMAQPEPVEPYQSYDQHGFPIENSVPTVSLDELQQQTNGNGNQ